MFEHSLFVQGNLEVQRRTGCFVKRVKSLSSSAQYDKCRSLFPCLSFLLLCLRHQFILLSKYTFPGDFVDILPKGNELTELARSKSPEGNFTQSDLEKVYLGYYCITSLIIIYEFQSGRCPGKLFEY